MNRGHAVVLATSDRPSDDLLANRARERGIEVFRGDLLDVRSRFVEISRVLDDDDVIVRLTGDNTFPDGNLVELAVAALLATDTMIVRSMEDSHLPYGLAVEAFRTRDLRQSLTDTSAAALEHVTPPLVRKQKSFASFVPLENDYSNLRCTLDTMEDFETLQTVFAEVDDPVGISWQKLVDNLAAISNPSRER